jgi:CheY-like chemotaxis protein
MLEAGKPRTHFPVVELPEEIRKRAVSNAKPAAKSKPGDAAKRREKKPARILSVAYNGALRQTRHLLLEKRGYEVTSAGDRMESIEHCRTKRFDLVILGQTVPFFDRRAILAELRARSDAPVLSIANRNDQIANADYHFHPGDGPVALLATVERIIEQRGGRGSDD